MKKLILIGFGVVLLGMLLLMRYVNQLKAEEEQRAIVATAPTDTRIGEGEVDKLAIVERQRMEAEAAAKRRELGTIDNEPPPMALPNVPLPGATSAAPSAEREQPAPVEREPQASRHRGSEPAPRNSGGGRSNQSRGYETPPQQEQQQQRSKVASTDDLFNTEVSSKPEPVESAGNAASFNAGYESSSRTLPELAVRVAGDQRVTPGGNLVMRLAREAVVNGVKIPRNATVYGRVSLSGDRGMVSVNQIKTAGGILKVNYTVFDEDGQPGISLSGMETNQAAGEARNRLLNGVVQNLPGGALVQGAGGALRNRSNGAPPIVVPDLYRLTLKGSN